MKHSPKVLARCSKVRELKAAGLSYAKIGKELGISPGVAVYSMLANIPKSKRKIPCEQCGSEERVQRHHPDYNNPEQIRYLCFLCHRKEHRVKDYLSERTDLSPVERGRRREAGKRIAKRNEAARVWGLSRYNGGNIIRKEILHLHARGKDVGTIAVYTNKPCSLVRKVIAEAQPNSPTPQPATSVLAMAQPMRNPDSISFLFREALRCALCGDEFFVMRGQEEEAAICPSCELTKAERAEDEREIERGQV